MLHCIDTNNPNTRCGKPAVTSKTHGWLCIGHYQQQQRNIPANPRLPQPKWNGQKVVESDVAIIRDILQVEKQAIAEGKVVQIKRGALEPVFLKLLEPPTVH